MNQPKKKRQQRKKETNHDTWQIYKEGIKFKQNAMIFSNTCRNVQHLKERMHGLISKNLNT